MKLTIIVDDNAVGVDTIFRIIDLTSIDPTIHAVQWDETVGHIEYKDDSPNLHITDISTYQTFIDMWTTAGVPIPTLDELKEVKRIEFMNECLVRAIALEPAWNTIDIIIATTGILWPYLVTDATVEQILVKDIYVYIRDIVTPKITAIASQSALDAVDPTVADPFSDNTPWPT